VIDDELAFVGGVDLTDLGGDRWDTRQHPARGRLGWHDAGTRLPLWSEHLAVPEDEIAGDTTEIVDRMWIPIAGREAERRRSGGRREHRLRELSPSSRKLERLLGPMDAMVVDAYRPGAIGSL
jgi:hypothetical protein